MIYIVRHATHDTTLLKTTPELLRDTLHYIFATHSTTSSRHILHICDIVVLLSVPYLKFLCDITFTIPESLFHGTRHKTMSHQQAQSPNHIPSCIPWSPLVYSTHNNVVDSSQEACDEAQRRSLGLLSATYKDPGKTRHVRQVLHTTRPT